MEGTEEQRKRFGCADILPLAETSIPARFAELAARHSTRIALGGATWRLTYAELDAVTNGVAHKVISRGGKVGDRVALLMKHDAPMIAAALAVLKAGRIVAVLNPTDPPARLKQVIFDSEPGLIVTDAANAKLAKEITDGLPPTICFEEQTTEAAQGPDMAIAHGSAAWLLYTSGSTGRPKAVIQTHRNIVHNVFRHDRGMNLNAKDRVLLLASPSGGQGMATVWCALLSGAGLYPFPVIERGVAGLKQWMTDHKITVYVSATSLFRHFAKTLNETDFFPGVKLVRFGSETVTASDFAACQRIFPNKCVVLHSLSSSETGNIAQQRFPHDLKATDRALSVGWPAEGVELLLKDENGREVSDGQIGEITVRSHYLSPGYWRNKGLTAEHFTDDPDSGAREFRSGDFACRGTDGALIFMGRKDAQVKVRGFRVDISEIKTVLMRQPEVEAAVVTADRTPNEDVKLVAHLVLPANKKDGLETLKRTLRETLPGHMVPATFIIIDHIPLTSHGKIDFEKLRQIKPVSPTQQAVNGTATATEFLLMGIWKKVFNRESIARDEDFFVLGGDSLNAAVVAAEVHAALNVNLDLGAFNKHSTLSGLAAEIDKLRSVSTAGNSPCLALAPRNSALPLSFRQEEVWKASQTTSGALAYTMACSHLVTGPLDACVLRESMNYLIHRHEILRTTFGKVKGQAAQIVHSPETVALRIVDFAGAPDAEAKAMDVFREEAARVFDLTRLPLMRFALVKIREDEHWLVRINHHIVFDAWSWKLFFTELGRVYEAKLRGEKPPLPESESLQYCDYAAHQRSTLDAHSGSYQEMLEWWVRLHSEKTPALKPPFQRRWKSRDARPNDGLVWWGFDPAITRRLEDLGIEAAATHFVIRLAAFSALMRESARGRDVIVGTYMTGRNSVELQGMLGDFTNQVILRFPCEPTQTFREWVSTVRKLVLEAQARSVIPYERVREELLRRGASPPDVRAVFTISEHTAPVRFGGMEITWQERRMEGMPWGFCMTLDRHQEERGCRASFDASIHDPARVRKWLDRFARFMRAASEKPDLSLEKLLAISKE